MEASMEGSGRRVTSVSLPCRNTALPSCHLAMRLKACGTECSGLQGGRSGPESAPVLRIEKNSSASRPVVPTVLWEQCSVSAVCQERELVYEKPWGKQKVL